MWNILLSTALFSSPIFFSLSPSIQPPRPRSPRRARPPVCPRTSAPSRPAAPRQLRPRAKRRRCVCVRSLDLYLSVALHTTGCPLTTLPLIMPRLHVAPCYPVGIIRIPLHNLSHPASHVLTFLLCPISLFCFVCLFGAVLVLCRPLVRSLVVRVGVRGGRGRAQRRFLISARDARRVSHVSPRNLHGSDGRTHGGIRQRSEVRACACVNVLSLCCIPAVFRTHIFFYLPLTRVAYGIVLLIIC
jgi:hypothetical protein